MGLGFLGNKYAKQLVPLVILLVVLPLILIAIPQAVNYLGRASGVPANLAIDYQGVLGPMPRPWRNLAQGGEEKGRMLEQVTGEIRALQTEYVRIDHIYDQYDVVKYEGNQLSYDWTKLDLTINDILKSGAKPYLALSYYPPAIAKGDIISEPKDWSLWQAVVKATVEHYSGRNGLNISDVYYEVWNEPDLFGGFKTYGPKNYNTLYLYSARGAAQAQNVTPYKIGGPAITALYQNWVHNFLNFAVANKLRVDFISWHRYDFDLAVYENDLINIKSWLEQHPEFAGIEIHITEWGHDPKNHAGYDNMFGAIHTIAGARVMMGVVDKGFVFEIKDGPGNSQYWSRWGMLTHEKFGKPVRKPRFSALQFLNTLGDQRVSVIGEGSWVKAIAALKDNQLQTLIVNYDPKGQHTEAVPVTFENLPSGNFVYQRTDFLGKTVSKQIATDSAVWSTTELMRPNSAAMITLSF